tara:strand:- start:1013 stop:1375 length:363 start_codon:yes stop_codon:yes gene_type:complete
MDVVVAILVILMSMIVGYLISEWVHINKENRKAEKKSKESVDRFMSKPRTSDEAFKTITYTDEYGLNFHSTSTQGPPRRSVMATLEATLKAALKNENYEYAAKLRDRINKQKNNEDNNSC